MTIKPFPKSAARQFAEGSRHLLQCMEEALKKDDWEEVYQTIYSIGGNADYLVQKYEDWAYGDPS